MADKFPFENLENAKSFKDAGEASRKLIEELCNNGQVSSDYVKKYIVPLAPNATAGGTSGEFKK